MVFQGCGVTSTGLLRVGVLPQQGIVTNGNILDMCLPSISRPFSRVFLHRKPLGMLNGEVLREALREQDDRLTI